MFDHKVMKKASSKFPIHKIFPFTGEDPVVVQKLQFVAGAFVRYKFRSTLPVPANLNGLESYRGPSRDYGAARAFDAWESIKSERIAQDYLMSLLIKLRD